MPYSIKVITTDSKSEDLGSIPSGATMSTSFKYNGKIWNPKNPEKKLKQLGITWEDVEILETKQEAKQETERRSLNELFYFLNKKTGWSITSIHPCINDNDYEQCTKETLETLWHRQKSK